MKKRFLLLGLTSLLIAGCQNNQISEPFVMATLFPQYSMARYLLDDIVEVKYLLEDGQSSHDFEPSPSEVVALNQAQVVFFSSETMEPWIHNIEESAKGLFVDLSTNITLMESHEHEEDMEDEHDHGDFDPHYWIDPANGLLMLDTIVEVLLGSFPNEEVLIQSRANNLQDAFEDTLMLYESLLGENEELEIVFAGHNAFGYLENYAVHVLSPYAGFSDEVIPTAASLTEFVTFMETLEKPYLYVSETDNQAVIDALIEAIPNLETIELFTMGGVPSSLEIDAISYEEMLLLNYEAIARSL